MFWHASHTHRSASAGELTWNENLFLSLIVSPFSFLSSSVSDSSLTVTTSLGVSTFGVLLLFVGIGNGRFPGMVFLLLLGYSPLDILCLYPLLKLMYPHHPLMVFPLVFFCFFLIVFHSCENSSVVFVFVFGCFAILDRISQAVKKSKAGFWQSASASTCMRSIMCGGMGRWVNFHRLMRSPVCKLRKQ